MQPRTTLVLALVAAALGAFVWFYELGGEGERAAAKQAEERILPGFAAGDVEWIELLTTEGAVVRAERGGSKDVGWRLVEPLAFPADAVALDGIASALEQLVPENEIEAPQPPAVYGLGDDAPTVRFGTGGEERALRSGRSTPVGASTYVGRPGDAAVYTVPTWRVNALQKSLDDLRDRRVLPFEPALARRIEARWPGGGVVLAREDRPAGADDATDANDAADDEAGVEAGEWQLVEPALGAAHPATVRDLLSDLRYLRADGFVDEALGDEAAGLAPPDFELVLALAADEASGTPARTLRFALGAERDGRRLARAAQAVLYSLPPERIADFPRELVQYRDRRMARFAVPEAAALELEFSDPGGEMRRVRITRVDGAWRAEPGPSLRAGLVDALLERLSTLDASGIDADRLGPAELAAFGLAPPRVRLRVRGSTAEADETAPLADLLIGTLDARRGLAAMKAEDSRVYRLDADVAQDLPIDVAAYDARFAEPQAEPDDPRADAAEDASLLLEEGVADPADSSD